MRRNRKTKAAHKLPSSFMADIFMIEWTTAMLIQKFSFADFDSNSRNTSISLKDWYDFKQYILGNYFLIYQVVNGDHQLYNSLVKEKLDCGLNLLIKLDNQERDAPKP